MSAWDGLITRAMPPTRAGHSCRVVPPTRDRDVRALLKQWLQGRHAGERDTVVVEELGLNRRLVRADVAVVNGILHGYEIKAARDRLNRLAQQVRVYGDVFDRSTLVVDSRHLSKARALIPDWWEIITIVDGVLRVERRGRRNPLRQPRTLVELIWRDDALALLEKKGEARGFGRLPRHEIWDRVCELYSLDEIAAVVRSHLKARAAHAAG